MQVQIYSIIRRKKEGYTTTISPVKSEKGVIAVLKIRWSVDNQKFAIDMAVNLYSDSALRLLYKSKTSSHSVNTLLILRQRYCRYIFCFHLFRWNSVDSPGPLSQPCWNFDTTEISVLLQSPWWHIRAWVWTNVTNPICYCSISSFIRGTRFPKRSGRNFQCYGRNRYFSWWVSMENRCIWCILLSSHIRER